MTSSPATSNNSILLHSVTPPRPTSESTLRDSPATPSSSIIQKPTTPTPSTHSSSSTPPPASAAPHHVKKFSFKFAEDTSWPGIGTAILSKSGKRRRLWIFFLIFLACFCLGFVIYHFYKYFSFPKKISVDIVDGGVPFPWITICSMRRVDFYAAHRLTLLMKSLDNTSDNLDRADGDIRDKKSDEFVTAYRDLYLRINKTIHSYIHDRKEGEKGHSAEELRKHLLSTEILFTSINPNILRHNSARREEFIVFCTHAQKGCDAKLFEEQMKTPYYKCYTYKTPESFEAITLKEGKKDGWSAVVLAGSGMLSHNIDDTDVFVPGVHDGLQADGGAEGVRVVIHAPNTSANPVTEGLDIPPGFSASLGLRLGIKERLSKPYGECDTRNPYGSVSSTLDQKSLTSCDYCLQAWIIKGCNCKDSTLLTNLYAGHEICHSGLNITRKHFDCRYCQDFNDATAKDMSLKDFVERLECKDRLKGEFSSQDRRRVECRCQPLCREYAYDVSYSLSKWPPTGFEGHGIWRDIFMDKKFQNNFNTSKEKFEMYRKYVFNQRSSALSDFSRINVFVEDKNVVITTEVADYDFFQFWAELGGEFGLWIGVSIVTVLEIFELAYFKRQVSECYKL